MTARPQPGDRQEIELAILLASPTYDTTTAIDAIEDIVRKRAAAELRAAAEALHIKRFEADADAEDDLRRPDTYYAGIVRARIHLRDRADALDPS